MDSYDYESPPSTDYFYPSNNRINAQLWVDSEITGKFVAPQISFSKEKRFKWSSIYWPEDSDHLLSLKKKRKSDIYEAAQKISKMIDEEEKNEVRIKQIKRTFSSGKAAVLSARREAGVVLSTKKPFKLSKQNEEIVLRLKPRERRRQSLLRDRHGNRCNLFEDPESEGTRQDARFFGDSTGFKTSKKLRLQLPHNYFPGPGSYQIKRFLAKQRSARESTSQGRSAL